MAATDRHVKDRSVPAMLTAGEHEIEQAGGQADVLICAQCPVTTSPTIAAQSQRYAREAII